MILRVFITFWLLIVTGTGYAAVVFDGTETLIPPTQWRILDADTIPSPEKLAAEIDAHHWVYADAGANLSYTQIELLRLDIQFDYDGSQHPLLLIPYTFVPTMTVGLFHKGEVLMWMSLENQMQFLEGRINRTMGMIPLPMKEAGNYQLVVVGSLGANTVLVKGAKLHLDRDYILRDYPSTISMSSALVGVLGVFSVFCIAVVAYRFRLDLFYAMFFLIGSMFIILLREGVMFLNWDLDVSWWILRTLPCAMAMANFGILMYIVEDHKPMGWRRWGHFLNGCAWVLFAAGVLSVIFPVRVYPWVGLLTLSSCVIGFVLALGLMYTRAFLGTRRDIIFAICVGSFLLATLHRVSFSLFFESEIVATLPLYLTMVVVGFYIFVGHLVAFVKDYVNEEARKSADLTRIDMVSRFSHELRTPLNAVIGLSDLMKGARKPDQVDSYAGMIQSAGHTLLGLVNDILDFSKLGITGIPLVQQPLRFDRLITDVVSGFIPQSFETNIVPKIDLDPDMPFFVLGDELRLKQIFSNLVSNAIKFSQANQCVTVHIKPGRVDGENVELLCRVSDSGRGIPAAKLATIFEPYTQADAGDSRHMHGTGLGLAICKLLIEQMGGEIYVESEEGQGAIFHFNIWLKKNPAAPDLARCFSPLKNKQVLVVSSLDLVTTMMPRFLQHWGAEVTVVDSVFEAADRPFDLIFLESLYHSEAKSVDWLNKQPPETVIDIAITKAQSWIERIAHPNVHELWVPLPMLSIVAAIVEHLSGQEVDFAEVTKTSATLLHQNHQVLLVDDNAVNLTVGNKLLESLGVSCRTARGGEQALKILGVDQAYSLVLLDCEMPDVSGFEVCRQWRQIEEEKRLSPLPIVALTAHALDEVRDECLAAGMDDVLYKPVGRDVLIEILNRFPQMDAAVARDKDNDAFDWVI